MITLRDLKRNFGDFTAVDNLTFEVDEGEIFGLLGPNGAGKTTTVRMLCSLIKPTSGTAEVGGHDIVEEGSKVRDLVGLLPEVPGLYEELSAYRNLEFYAKLYGVPEDKREENIERFLKLLGLWDRRHDSIGSFSKGMRQKIAIIRALVHEPDVLFLDEPTAALSPEAAKVVRDFILDLKHEKRTTFICTHNLYEAERLCDRVAIIDEKLVDIGSPEELSRKLGPAKTKVQLERVTEEVIESVRKIDRVQDVLREENGLLVSSDEPEEVNPSVIEAVVGAGGRVQYVTEAGHGLEETYLKLVNKSESG